MKETIPQYLETQGYRGRVVSIHHLRALQEEIQGRQELIDEDLNQRYLSRFDYLPPRNMPNADSLIVVAYGDPPVRFTFGWKGKSVKLTVPPTYLKADAKDAEVGRVLKELLAPQGYHLAQIVVPEKLLAVRSGLARYGKNNITYVEGLGSFYRLVVFCSDYPCEAEPWIEARMLDRCEQCQACQRGCPSGAIGADRFLLRAERCLTFWNEKPGRIAFPDWVEDSWHNCVVGCLHCQRVCPENSELQDWHEEGVEFSGQETELILAGGCSTEFPLALNDKLERWDLFELLDMLPRNLQACLENSSQ
jgi:epoxyqueuosine reductase